MNDKPLSKTLHITPGITLEQFIAMKPKELRLVQWFVNCYYKRNDLFSRTLCNLDGACAKRCIINQINDWQWSTLPEIIV